MDKEKVLNLAKLARISISDQEAENLSHEFDAILGYVGEIKTSPQPLSLSKERGEGRGGFNVMRDDSLPHEPGLYTEKILSQAPSREGSYIKVKKIL